MHIASRSPKFVNRTHTSPTQNVFSPERHSVQFERLKTPSEFHQHVYKKPTHKLSKFSGFDDYWQHHIAKSKLDRNFSESEESYAPINPYKQR